MTDLNAIRARHAADETLLEAWRRRGGDGGPGWGQAHADRAALLAEVDALTRERDALNAVARRCLDAQAALDRLAGVTVDEIAKVIAFAFLTPPGAIPAAEAALAHVRKRVAGP